MSRRKWMPRIAWLLLLDLGLFGITSLNLLGNTSLQRQGIAAQGVVIGQQPTSCYKGATMQAFSVQFTDRIGQTHTSFISQCDYGSFSPSVGESVSILYLPDDPNVIAPSNGLMTNAQYALIFTVLFGLIALLLPLLLLFLWIRERLQKGRRLDLSTEMKGKET